jgi:tetratricopeptide (TPR) repeat protein
MLAVGQIETGQAASAISVLQSALAVNPLSAELHFNDGRALESTGKLDEAAVEYAAALKLRNDYPDALIALGNLSLIHNDFQAASQHFKIALAGNPDLERAHFELAKALKALNQTREAQLEFQQASALIQRQSDAVMSSHLSNESLDLAKKGDFANAVQTARKALTLDPTNANAHDNLGLLLADTGDLRSGLLELRKAISLMPMRVSAYVDMARMQMRLNDRTAALVVMEKAAFLDARDRGVQKELATVREAMHTPTKSEVVPHNSDFAFLFGAPQDSPTGHFAFAVELRKEGDDAGAIGELQRALQLRPTEKESRYNLALVYQQIGDSRNAKLELLKILYASPDSVEAHLALGGLMLKEKEDADAVREFKQVLAIQPDNREAARLLAQTQASATPP